MAKTEFSPKVSAIRPEDRAPEPAKTKASRVDPGILDDYQEGSANPYHGLLEGKAQTAFGALTDAVSTPTGRPADPIQSLLGNLMVGGPTHEVDPTRMGHELPRVPDCQREILKDIPDQKFHMQPVIDNYVGLEKVILTLMEQTEQKLKPHMMARLTTQEIATLREYKRQLASQLWECREQLRIARIFDTWAEQEQALQDELDAEGS